VLEFSEKGNSKSMNRRGKVVKEKGCRREMQRLSPIDI